MSETFNVQTVTIAVGPVVGAQDVPLFRVPTVGGGITVVDGLLTLNETGGTAAAAQFGTAVAARIVTHGTLGGVANGTAGSAIPAVDGTVGYFGALGSINLGAGTVHTLLAGTPYIGPGKFVNYAHTAGTLLGGFTVQISYVMGK